MKDCPCSHFHMVYTTVIPCAAKPASNNWDTLRVTPGSLQYAGRRVGRVTAVQCVGGMTLGEEAAVVRECGLLKESLGFSEGNLAMLKSDQMPWAWLPIAKVWGKATDFSRDKLVGTPSEGDAFCSKGYVSSENTKRATVCCIPEIITSHFQKEKANSAAVGLLLG